MSIFDKELLPEFSWPTEGREVMSDCGHVTLRSGNTFDTLQRVEPCLYCERNALRSRLAEAEHRNSDYEKAIATLGMARDEMRELLREWCASAFNIESGEAIAKVEQKFVTRCRAALEKP